MSGNYVTYLLSKPDNEIIRRQPHESEAAAKATATQFMRNRDPLKFHTQVWLTDPGSSAPPILIEGDV